MRTMLWALGAVVLGCAADSGEPSGGVTDTDGGEATATDEADDGDDDAPATSGADDGDDDGDGDGDDGGPATTAGDDATSGPGTDTGDSTDGDAPMDEPPPTDAAALGPWLESGAYLRWNAESGVHESAGPHFGGVRTFVDDALFASLQAGNAEHPVGAAAVKELYADGDEVRGWSVMVKVQLGAGGDGWYWYELYDGSVLAEGTGLDVCTGCHGSGSDHVRSPFPLQ